MAVDRYTKTAIALHWVIAVAIVIQLGTGITMGFKLVEKSILFPMYQFHKSVGLTVLVLSLFRLFWRLGHRPPPLPQHMPRWEIWSARLSHYLFYFFILAVPMTGWLIVSSSSFGFPTEYFSLFTWPHIPGVEALGDARKQQLNEWSETLHVYLAYSTLALLIVHIAAALKHHFLNHDDVLHHMIPVVRPKLPLCLLAFSLLSFPAQAENWQIDPQKSRIEFSGLNSGDKFSGVFNKWSGEIDFDEARPEASSVKIMIDTGSAATGTKTYDATLSQKEWFDVKSHPQAIFETTAIRSLGDHKFEAKGRLTIKGITKDLTLPFLLTTSDKNALMTATAKVDRTDFDIGKSSDPTGDWVAKDIDLSIKVDATKK